MNQKQCHLLEAGWVGTVCAAFEDFKNVTFKRVRPSPITHHVTKLGVPGVVGWGESILLWKWCFWDGAGRDQGAPDPLSITCHSGRGAPPPAGISGPAGGVIRPAEEEAA